MYARRRGMKRAFACTSPSFQPAVQSHSGRRLLAEVLCLSTEMAPQPSLPLSGRQMARLAWCSHGKAGSGVAVSHSGAFPKHSSSPSRRLPAITRLPTNHASTLLQCVLLHLRQRSYIIQRSFVLQMLRTQLAFVSTSHMESQGAAQPVFGGLWHAGVWCLSSWVAAEVSGPRGLLQMDLPALFSLNTAGSQETVCKILACHR